MPGIFRFEGAIEELADKICNMMEVFLKEDDEKTENLNIIQVSEFIMSLPSN